MLFLAGCHPETDDSASSETEVSGLDFAVDAPGPFGVGFRTWEVTYTPAGLAPRTIVVSAWYPTTDTHGPQALDTIGFILSDVYANATLAPLAYPDGYPVVVHSHGYQGWAANSFDLARYFATHGWVFIAPDHTGNTLFDSVEPLPLEHYADRPLDIRATLDSIDADPALGGLARTETALLSGHSFGAYTTWAVGGSTYDTASIAALCASGSVANGDCPAAALALFETDLSDPRVVATLPMAGAIRAEWFGTEGYRTKRGPTFFMSGTNDDVGQQEQWDAMPDANLTWIEIEGGCHQTFGLGTCDTLDPETGWQIVNTYGLAHARATILGDTSVTGILDGTVPVSDLVTLQKR